MRRRDWLMALAGAQAGYAFKGNTKLFDKENLVAWCIVPFDAKQRGPEERARMLRDLGIRRLAYDWRDKDIPTFDAELDALNRHGIRLEAFWLASDMNVEANKSVRVVLDFLKRRKVGTAIWLYLGTPKEFADLDRAVRATQYVARQAKQIGCTVDLYNHGGWSGEPENQVSIIQKAGMDNVGIVYNFHHGREHMDRFPELFRLMLPYLKTLNLNGMKKDGPMIMTIGEGDRELDMLRVVSSSPYRGRIGILNHRTDQDAEVGLRRNMQGLDRLVLQLGRSS